MGGSVCRRVRGVWFVRVFPVVAAAAFVLASSPWSLAQSLDGLIAETLERASLGSSRVGISVVDVETGRELVSIRSRERFIPASNMKLLTSGAALAVLGADFEFRTEILLAGDRVVVVGSGDPALGDPVLLERMGMTVDGFLDRIVEAVEKAGGEGIREVVVDDRVFDETGAHPTWPRDQLNRWYCAEVRGVNFHANILRVYVHPGDREGDAPVVRTEPAAGWFDVRNRARTARSGTTSVWVARELGANVFTLHGSVRSALERAVDVAVHAPSEVFGRLLAERIERRGLGAERGVRARLAGEEEVFGGGEPTIVIRSPMEVVLSRCNADSHNLYAEALLKRVGHASTGQRGSWANGSAAIRMQVHERLGHEAAAALSVADGSGMSRANGVSPALLTGWLVAMANDGEIGEEFVMSLPVAAEEGTVANRFRDGRPDNEVRAKSGYISGVRCLSGYVTDPRSGRRVAFSILVNETPASVPGLNVRRFHERVVRHIDEWVGSQTGMAAESTGDVGRGG